ncbi:MAG: S9 family peptidase [Caulobacteraceae bacterium]
MSRATVGAIGAAAAGLLAAAFPAAAQSDGPSRTFGPADVFSLRYAADPQIRPDGAAVAYVRGAYDIMTDKAARSIWAIDLASGAQSPLVEGPAAGEPRWSPDGQRLAFVAAAEGTGPQLFVRWMASGVTAKVAALPQAPGDIAWSPDGRQLAFTMFAPAKPVELGVSLAKPEGAKWAEPLRVIDTLTYRFDGEGYLKAGQDHLWVVSADGGAPRQLTFGPFEDGGRLAWTPDGRFVLFSAHRAADWRRHPMQSDICQVAVADAALTCLTHGGVVAGDPTVSPDGRQVAYVGFTDTHRPYQDPKLMVMDRDGGHARSLTDGLDRPVASPWWAADGRSLYVGYADRSVVKVARVGLDGKARDVATGLAGGGLDRPYVGGAFTVARNGVVAFTQGGPDEPAEVAVSAAGAARRLTRLNDDLMAGKTLAKVAPLAVTSAFDHQAVDAWIVTPPNFDPARKYPMILEIHGGPYAAYGKVWASEMQLYAAAGYVVAYANPRGSVSYGDAFASGIAHDYPGHDYDDLMSVVDAAIAKGFVDPDNLFVTGGSGGGLLTAWIVGKTGRFRAAASQKPVIDWTSFALTTDIYPLVTDDWFGKPPWEDHEAYWRRSPLSLVGAVKTPTLVMVGEDDHRTPPSQAEQFYQALQLRGVPATLIRVPGASHESLADRPSQLDEEVAAILAWFERYKVRDGGPAAGG